MPVYLAHGFRWPRDGYTGIRVYTIMHNLEDVSSEYIQNDHSRTELLRIFREKYPKIMAELEKPGTGRAIDFLEQYDPEDTSAEATTQPWAFVCDRIVMIAGGDNAEKYASQLLHHGGHGGIRPNPVESPKKKERKKTLPMTIAAPFTSQASVTSLSVNVEEVTADGPGMSTEAWQALADLRDQIAGEENIGWWVVVNGDPDREYDEEEDEEQGEETPAASPQKEPLRSPTGGRMPPPVPPSTNSKGQQSSPNSTRTPSSLSSGTTPGKERTSSEPNISTTTGKTTSKSRSLSKIFGKKS